MKSFFVFLAAASLFAAGPVLAGPEPRGTVLELHSCELYAGGCTVSAEATQAGRYLLRVWDFEGGQFRGADFRGLKVAVLQSAPENLAAPGTRATEAVVYLPDTADAAERKALLEWVKATKPDLAAARLQVRTESLKLEKNAAEHRFTAGKYLSVATKPLEPCDTRSCGEELWYSPRTKTSLFTVAVNRSSSVQEPLLKLHWNDSAQRSVFLGRFGDAESRREVFVTLNEFCGTTGLF